MNLKKLAEAIGRQRVLLHIDGIGIREMAISDIMGIYCLLKHSEIKPPEEVIRKQFLRLSTEPSNQFQSGELANLN